MKYFPENKMPNGSPWCDGSLDLHSAFAFAFARCELKLLGHKEPKPCPGPTLWPTYSTQNEYKQPRENTTRLENNQK